MTKRKFRKSFYEKLFLGFIFLNNISNIKLFPGKETKPTLQCEDRGPSKAQTIYTYKC